MHGVPFSKGDETVLNIVILRDDKKKKREIMKLGRSTSEREKNFEMQCVTLRDT